MELNTMETLSVLSEWERCFILYSFSSKHNVIIQCVEEENTKGERERGRDMFNDAEATPLAVQNQCHKQEQTNQPTNYTNNFEIDSKLVWELREIQWHVCIIQILYIPFQHNFFFIEYRWTSSSLWSSLSSNKVTVQ